jgi:hypothetical protein
VSPLKIPATLCVESKVTVYAPVAEVPAAKAAALPGTQLTRLSVKAFAVDQAVSSQTPLGVAEAVEPVGSQ